MKDSELNEDGIGPWWNWTGGCNQPKYPDAAWRYGSPRDVNAVDWADWPTIWIGWPMIIGSSIAVMWWGFKAMLS